MRENDVAQRAVLKGGGILESSTYSQDSTQDKVSWAPCSEDLTITRTHDCSLKRTRGACDLDAGPIKRHKCSTSQILQSYKEELPCLPADCALLRVDSSLSDHESIPVMRSVPSLEQALSHNLSLSCSESVVFSTNTSGDGSDLEASAQSPRRETPTPPTVTPTLPPTPPTELAPELIRILNVLRSSEAASDVDPDYLNSKHSVTHLSPTTFLDASMRRTCVSWMVEVAAEFDLSQETLHLSIASLDRFLSATRAVPRSQLQLVAVACLLVASKHEDESHPSAADLSTMAAHSFTPADLVRMEGLLLSGLKFCLAEPTVYTFLSLFKGILNLRPEVHALAAYYAELAMLEYSMLRVAPSVLAAGAVVLAAGHLGDGATLQALNEAMPGINVSVGPCLGALQKVIAKASERTSLNIAFCPIREKFSTRKWHKVAIVVERCNSME